MKPRSVAFGKFLAMTGVMVFILGSRPAAAGETPPDLYRSAPIIPYAKSIGEHRYRSPRTYEDTVTYYKKVYQGDNTISFEKIINNSGVRGVHMKNKAPGGRWEGLNIYEYKGTTTIFVVFSDKELQTIAEEKHSKLEKKGKTPGKAGP